MAQRETGKGAENCVAGKISLSLAFFLIFFSVSLSSAQQSGASYNFPVITRMDSWDTSFRQYINDVEGNRRRLVNPRTLPIEAAEYLTIYQYTTRQGEDLFSVAARSNVPYSTLASINRLSNPGVIDEGRTLLLPSCPGIFIPATAVSELEKLLWASRLQTQESVELKINIAGRQETFYFFPGSDYTPTERAFFLNSGFFRFPLVSYRLTSPYGMRQNPVTGNVVMHQGMDLAAPEGTEVYAVADGVVTEIGEDPIYGIYVIITHRDRWTSLYGHLQKTETDLRSNVRSGTLIGRVGSTGQSTGPHLHFELRQNDRAVDPSGRLRS